MRFVCRRYPAGLMYIKRPTRPRLRLFPTGGKGGRICDISTVQEDLMCSSPFGDGHVDSGICHGD